MKKELNLSRRENGLTIRYLAQGLFNDLLMPNQSGIKTLISKAKSCAYKGKKISLNDSKIEHAFLFHLEDFIKEGEKDKSEIDLLMCQDDSLFIVEVKAFSDANALGVKRELLRNYLRIKSIQQNKKYFQNLNIITILLYSKSYQNDIRKKSDFEYFNENFLFKKGKNQNRLIKDSDWKEGNYKIDKKLIERFNLEFEIEELSQNLYFLTWNDVLKTYEELNKGDIFSAIIEELKSKKDTFSKGFNHQLI